MTVLDIIIGITGGAFFLLAISFIWKFLEKKRFWNIVFNFVLAAALLISPAIVDYNGNIGKYIMIISVFACFIAAILMLLYTLRHVSLINIVIVVFLFGISIAACLEKYYFDKSFYEAYLTFLCPAITVGIIFQPFQISNQKSSS